MRLPLELCVRLYLQAQQYLRTLSDTKVSQTCQNRLEWFSICMSAVNLQFHRSIRLLRARANLVGLNALPERASRSTLIWFVDNGQSFMITGHQRIEENRQTNELNIVSSMNEFNKIVGNVDCFRRFKHAIHLVLSFYSTKRILRLFNFAERMSTIDSLWNRISTIVSLCRENVSNWLILKQNVYDCFTLQR